MTSTKEPRERIKELQEKAELLAREGAALKALQASLRGRDANQLAHAERLLWLAKRKIECPRQARPLALHGHGCDLCQGTGKVPRFPMLRQECDECEGIGQHRQIWVEDHDEPDGRDCECCQGRGWVPVDSLEATLEAVFTLPDVQVISGKSEGQYSVLLLRTVGEWIHPKAWGKTINEAAISALYKAMRGEA